MTPIGVIILPSKEKDLVHNRGCNFDLITTKLYTLVQLIKIQIEFVDELYSTNREGRTFLQRKTFETLYRGRNIDPIVSKLGTKVGLVSILKRSKKIKNLLF